jgi:hypothetical protein
MEEGVSQGCPLSPIFASLVVVRLLQPLDTLLKSRAAACLLDGHPGDDGKGSITHLLGYVDDVSICIPLVNLSSSVTTLPALVPPWAVLSTQ